MNKPTFMSLAELVDRVRPGTGDEYQNGVLPGAAKLAQFRECCTLAELPPLYSQENVEDPFVRVKIFDPCGSWTWFLTEWDPEQNLAFGLVKGHEIELGYINLEELSEFAGRFKIGLELDMWWTPCRLSHVREEIK